MFKKMKRTKDNREAESGGVSILCWRRGGWVIRFNDEDGRIKEEEEQKCKEGGIGLS